MLTKNKLSKYILGFLGVIFIYHTFGYLVLYSPIKHLLKVSGQNSVLKKEINPEELNTFIFRINEIEKNTLNFRWVDKNEFEFNGMLYDVKHKTIEGDSLILSCLLDQNENIIDSIFSMLLQNNKNDTSKNQINITFLFGLYLQNFSNEINKIYNNDNSELTFSINEKVFKNYLCEIPTPPPRLFS